MRREVLPGGLRVLTAEQPATPLVAAKLFIKVGSRHDGGRPGIAHFVEHMLFRREWADGPGAFQQIEAVGGEINAVTHREYTALQAVLLAGDLPRIFHAFRAALAPLDLDAARVERERAVLLTEIGHATDTQAIIWDLFLQALWGEQDSLARPIYGTADSVQQIGAEDLRAHFARYLTPARMVLAVAGGVRHEEVVDSVVRAWPWAAAEVWEDGPWPRHRGSGRVGLVKDLQATHIVLGLDAVGLKDPRRPALKVMDIILGKGATSRLHYRLREDLGLVYQVTSLAMAFEDRGYLAVYTSCAPERVARVVESIVDELDRLRREPVSVQELEGARAYYEGALARHFETVLAQAGILGVEELLHQVEPFAESIERVRAVEAEDVQALAAELVDLDRVALAYVGRQAGGIR